MSVEIDNTIAQAKKRNALVFVTASAVTGIVVIFALVWLFLVNGYVLVVKPDEAGNQFSTQSVRGLTFGSGNNLYVFGSTASFIVESATFESVQVDITPDTPTNIEIVLPPLPAALRASTNVPGPAAEDITWYIDNSLVHIGPTLEQAFEPGQYLIEARHPHFIPWQDNITLVRAQEKPLQITLDTFEGQIQASATPDDATIFVNNTLLDKATLALTGGQYQVRVERDGYQTITDTVNVTFDNPIQARNYQLTPKQADIAISVSPAGGTLLINQIEHSPGVHTVNANEDILVSYAKAGYFSDTRTVRLSPAQRLAVDFKLKQANGNVRIQASPQAQVFIGKTLKGTTPLDLTLPAIEHKLVFKRQGYRTVEQTIQVKANNRQNISIEMLTEYDARRAEGRPLFATQIGFELKRFAPDSFVLGSKPNEPGRRRNEHPVKVNFDRHIYVSTTEVTEAQYARFKKTQSTSNKPITNVSWIDAVQFTNWLSAQEGLPPFYVIRGNQVVGINPDSIGYRLPTEAEWEWLAKRAKRAMATTYVWGNTDRIPRDAGNFADKARESQQLITLRDYDDGQAGVADVGSFRADRLGLHDMAGNVSEWVHDGYTNSLPDLDTTHMNYLGVKASGQHVVKGGNFTTGKLRDLRAAFRDPASEGSDTIGFRIARYAN